MERIRALCNSESDISDEEDDTGVNSFANILKLQSEFAATKYTGSNDNNLSTSLDNEFPLTSKVILPDYRDINKPITSISLPLKAHRMLCGILDGTVLIYDFNSMYSNNLNPLKSIVPLESHAIQALEYNRSGTMFLTACGDSSCRIYDHNGDFLNATVRGDPYVRAAKSNLGHTHMILDLSWHANDPNKFWTSAMDGTIRLFDINSKPYGIDQYIPSITTMKCLDKRNINISSISVNSISTSNLGNCIAAGCSDGSIQVFSSNSGESFSETPSFIIREAHKQELGDKNICDIKFLDILTGDIYLMSRGTSDKSLALWDLRKPKYPVSKVANLPCETSDKTNICISPCKGYVITGTSEILSDSSKGNYKFDKRGDLYIFDVNELLSDSKIKVDPYMSFEHGISICSWPSEINQIILGLDNGQVHIYYDGNSGKSNKGALLFVNKYQHLKYDGTSNIKTEVYNATNLPLGFKETRSGEIKYVGISSRNSKVTGPQQESIKTFPYSKETSIEDDYDIVSALRSHRSINNLNMKDSLKNSNKRHLDYSDYQDGGNLLKKVSICPRCGLCMCKCIKY
ncbi:hypothetical protein cand_004120 [Cryptosporidium andersoni]|uniref:Uncharacterized protein n=1 Tax=Cryptosporidium andersoni TaxID=117008 RepID=A0A1J4MLK9_9CRYT|nr:hypothetical protein cand_004120 [Cryptosporidium andersoni]